MIRLPNYTRSSVVEGKVSLRSDRRAPALGKEYVSNWINSHPFTLGKVNCFVLVNSALYCVFLTKDLCPSMKLLLERRDKISSDL